MGFMGINVRKKLLWSQRPDFGLSECQETEKENAEKNRTTTDENPKSAHKCLSNFLANSNVGQYFKYPKEGNS